jgi:N-hydroxyarylamine O-acetyltransferase
VSFDLDAYLARVRLPARPTVDSYGLQALQRAHRLTIPFENLDVFAGRPTRIDAAGVFDKLVTARRGGYCFEHDRLFGDALAALGFEARPLLARVWLGATGTPPLNHALTLVTFCEDAWIADPGFGGSYAPPMPLQGGAEVEAPDGARFRLERDAEGWTLLRRGDLHATDGRADGAGSGADWQRQYGFTAEEVGPDALQTANDLMSTSPDSRFRRHRVVSIALPRGFASLTDRRYRRSAGGERSEGEIADPRVYRMRLSLRFGIDLTAEQVDELGLF